MKQRSSAGAPRERRQGPKEGDVSRFRGLYVAALAATLSCSPAQLTPEDPTKRPVDVHSEVTEENRQKEPVVAPPPTYGNKIVQAEEESETRNL